MGRLSWIIWVNSVWSQGSLKVEEGHRKRKRYDDRSRIRESRKKKKQNAHSTHIWLSTNDNVAKALYWAKEHIFFFFSNSQHMEAPWPGMESEPQLQPMPQLWQCWILSPLWHGRNPKIIFLIKGVRSTGYPHTKIWILIPIFLYTQK